MYSSSTTDCDVPKLWMFGRVVTQFISSMFAGFMALVSRHSTDDDEKLHAWVSLPLACCRQGGNRTKDGWAVDPKHLEDIAHSTDHRTCLCVCTCLLTHVCEWMRTPPIYVLQQLWKKKEKKTKELHFRVKKTVIDRTVRQIIIVKCSTNGIVPIFKAGKNFRWNVPIKVCP